MESPDGPGDFIRDGKGKVFHRALYAMVESVAKHLINTGIPKKNIKKDTLIGY